MVKLSDLPTADEVQRARYESDPAYRREYDRLRLAGEVSVAVLKFRTEKRWSQAELARHLGMHQPAIARLEAGDHQPTVQMLERLASAGILSVTIEPGGTSVRALAEAS